VNTGINKGWKNFGFKPPFPKILGTQTNVTCSKEKAHITKDDRTSSYNHRTISNWGSKDSSRLI